MLTNTTNDESSELTLCSTIHRHSPLAHSKYLSTQAASSQANSGTRIDQNHTRLSRTLVVQLSLGLHSCNATHASYGTNYGEHSLLPPVTSKKRSTLRLRQTRPFLYTSTFLGALRGPRWLTTWQHGERLPERDARISRTQRLPNQCPTFMCSTGTDGVFTRRGRLAVHRPHRSPLRGLAWIA